MMVILLETLAQNIERFGASAEVMLAEVVAPVKNFMMQYALLALLYRLVAFIGDKLVFLFIRVPFRVSSSALSSWGEGVPYYFRNLREGIIYSVPNVFHGYHKSMLAIYFVDAYAVWWHLGQVYKFHALSYFYLVAKIVGILAPFALLSPVDRIPFWVLNFSLIFLEAPAICFAVICWGYGWDWEKAPNTLYKNWPKHFKYRRITGNRRIGVEVFCYFYPVMKLLNAFGVFCYEPMEEQYRLFYLHRPTRATEPSRFFEKIAAEVRESNATRAFDIGRDRRWGAPLTEDMLTRAPRKSLREQRREARLEEEIRQFNESQTRGAVYDYDEWLLPGHDYAQALLESSTVANLRYGVLFILALSSLTVYSIVLAGWSSNSKYAFIGALRSAAQMISYEVAISLILLPIVMLSGSMNLVMIVFAQSVTVWFILPLMPAAIMFLIAMLAETNRTPFDLPEAEAELVAGYNVDYSALPFAMFFLGEYCNMILISVLFCILFVGGWNFFGISGAFVLAIKSAVIWVFFILVRATLPRYRYDQLMDIGWKVFLPMAGGFLLVVIGIITYFYCVPVSLELPMQYLFKYVFIVEDSAEFLPLEECRRVVKIPPSVASELSNNNELEIKPCGPTQSFLSHDVITDVSALNHTPMMYFASAKKFKKTSLKLSKPDRYSPAHCSRFISIRGLLARITSTHTLNALFAAPFNIIENLLNNSTLLSPCLLGPAPTQFSSAVFRFSGEEPPGSQEPVNTDAPKPKRRLEDSWWTWLSPMRPLFAFQKRIIEWASPKPTPQQPPVQKPRDPHDIYNDGTDHPKDNAMHREGYDRLAFEELSNRTFKADPTGTTQVVSEFVHTSWGPGEFRGDRAFHDHSMRSEKLQQSIQQLNSWEPSRAQTEEAMHLTYKLSERAASGAMRDAQNWNDEWLAAEFTKAVVGHTYVGNYLCLSNYSDEVRYGAHKAAFMKCFPHGMFPNMADWLEWRKREYPNDRYGLDNGW